MGLFILILFIFSTHALSHGGSVSTYSFGFKEGFLLSNHGPRSFIGHALCWHD